MEHDSLSQLNNNAVDLRVIRKEKDAEPQRAEFTVNSGASTSRSCNSRSSGSSEKQKQKWRNVNMFKRHKLKYRYLMSRHKQSSDSGNFGSGSLVASSSNASLDKRSINETSSSPGTSSSLSSSDSQSPQNFIHPDIQSSEQSQSMCMMLGQTVPLVVMMQGQLQSASNRSSDISYSNTMLFKCNVCNMFSNNLTDVLNHLNSNHANVHYCFVCFQFHNSKSEHERHKDVCTTARHAFQQIIGDHYQRGHTLNNTSKNSQEQPLNLSVAGDVAIRAAQMVCNKKGKGRQNKIRKLQKCTYCKKAFFGRFYLQRHLRSHTGEKFCHCTICGKGFVEWRNLRNHMKRFHNSSSSSGDRQSKSVSPNMTSDSSDQLSTNPTVAALGSTHPPSLQQQSSGGSQELPNVDSHQASQVSFYPSLSKSISLDSASMSATAWSGSSAAYAVASSYYSKPQYTSSHSYDSSTSAGIYQNVSMLNAGPCESDMQRVQSQQLNMTNYEVNGEDEVKQSTSYLGSTSSRLELSSEQQAYDESLKPVSDESGIKVFRCHTCSKIFKTKFAMQRHLDFHADKRPFKCDQCDYKAKTRPQLKVHVMRHSGEKGFNCEICDYSCVTHSDLNRHRKSRSHQFREKFLRQAEEEKPMIDN